MANESRTIDQTNAYIVRASAVIERSDGSVQPSLRNGLTSPGPEVAELTNTDRSDGSVQPRVGNGLAAPLSEVEQFENINRSDGSIQPRVGNGSTAALPEVSRSQVVDEMKSKSKGSKGSLEPRLQNEVKPRASATPCVSSTMEGTNVGHERSNGNLQPKTREGLRSPHPEMARVPPKFDRSNSNNDRFSGSMQLRPQSCPKSPPPRQTLSPRVRQSRDEAVRKRGADMGMVLSQHPVIKFIVETEEGQRFVMFIIVALYLYLRVFWVDTYETPILGLHSMSTIGGLQSCTQPPFRILCTASMQVMSWGSYRIRCRDMKKFLKQVTNRVQVDDIPLKLAKGAYNVTLVIKDVIPPSAVKAVEGRNVSMGKFFVDVIDEYDLSDSKIPNRYEIIVQNPYHKTAFPLHKTHVVTHWFNSFPGDVEVRPLPLREIMNARDQMRLATVWAPQPFQAGCVDLSGVEGVSYDCIEENFKIADWYNKYLTMSERKAKSILENATLGPGFLYWRLFRTYDVLVVYSKNGKKLDFGNVQRAVSQMRSAVPVVVEKRGKVHELFLEKYNYSCGFTRDQLPSVVRRLRSLEEREKCRQEALRIVEDFSPEAIIKEFLSVFGYDIQKEQAMRSSCPG